MHYLLLISMLCSFSGLSAQVTWTGLAGDGQWITAGNWLGNRVPAATDDVVLDNSFVAGNYRVTIPGLAASVVIKSVVITPASGDSIELVIPASNTAAPAFSATGGGYSIIINRGGTLLNSSGSTGGAVITVTDSIQVNNGGRYTHNTRSSHAALVTLLSGMPGTEKGIFEFNVPGGGYTFASTNRTYGTLVFSAEASGGQQSYATSAASPLIINGDLIIEQGVTATLDISAATTIRGDYIQQGGTFNIASQANHNTINIKGNFMQIAGVITETSTGLPAIEMNGTNNQTIQTGGTINNSIGFTINNNAGVTLLTDLMLPFKLTLLNGILSTGSFMLALSAGCSIQADSMGTSFVNGRLRKEGLAATDHFLFPVGRGMVQRWVELKDATGNFTVEFFKSNPAEQGTVTGAGINHISSGEYWSVDADAPSSEAAIELSFDNVNSGGVTDITALRVAGLASGTWENSGNTATTGTAGTNGSVISTLLHTFGSNNKYFTLASSDAALNPLPLKLLSFSSHSNNNGIVINWVVENSWQPLRFELESSDDGNRFIFLSAINVVQNQFAYEYTDKRQPNRNCYYRLKAIEKDGNFFYSGVNAVNANTIAGGSVRIWPSVVHGNAQMIINAVVAGQANIEIYNTAGKTVFASSIFLQNGNNSMLLPSQQLPAGIYSVAVTMADHITRTVRFFKAN